MRFKVGESDLKFFESLHGEGLSAGYTRNDKDYNQPYIHTYTKSAQWLVKTYLEEKRG